MEAKGGDESSQRPGQPPVYGESLQHFPEPHGSISKPVEVYFQTDGYMSVSGPPGAYRDSVLELLTPKQLFRAGRTGAARDQSRRRIPQ